MKNPDKYAVARKKMRRDVRRASLSVLGDRIFFLADQAEHEADGEERAGFLRLAGAYYREMTAKLDAIEQGRSMA